MATIKEPFGGDLNPNFFSAETLTKVGATAKGEIVRAVSSMMSFLRMATAANGKTLKLAIADTLPAGAMLFISAQSASSEILLSASSFATRLFINSPTATKGTGNWQATFVYNGSRFIPFSKPVRPGVRKLV